MQTSLMFVDLSSQGKLPNIEKIAIKMFDGHNDPDAYGGFADIINTLMSAVPADKLQQSLDALEWVPVEEGDVTGYAPLIDLTKDQSKTLGMAKQLLDQAAPETRRQAATLKSLFFPTAESEADKVKNLDPGDGIKPAVQVREFRQNPIRAAGHQIGDGESEKLHPAANGGNTATEDLGKAKIAPESAKPQAADVIPNKETAAMARQPEGSEIEKRNAGESKAAQGPESANRLKAMLPIGQEAGQQTGQQSSGQQMSRQQTSEQQYAGNEKQEPELFLKQDTKSNPATDASHRHFKPGFTEGATETAPESSEMSTKGGTEARESFQVSMAKIKSSFGERMEGVSGGKEMKPVLPDLQSNVIRQIVQRMALQTNGAQSTMTIKLKPEFLGNVHMQISTDHQQVIVRMATESMAVKELVEQGLQHLRTELQHHGLEIDKFDVFVADDNEDSKPGQDWAGFRKALKRRQKNGMKKDNRESEKGGTPVAEVVGKRQAIKSAGEIDYFA